MNYKQKLQDFENYINKKAYKKRLLQFITGCFIISVASRARRIEFEALTEPEKSRTGTFLASSPRFWVMEAFKFHKLSGSKITEAVKLCSSS